MNRAILGVVRRVRRQIYLLALILLAGAIAILWQHFSIRSPYVPTTETVALVRVDEPIQPIPQQLETDLPKVLLGEKLFADVRLSQDNRISCLNCHNFSLGGADRRVLSPSINGAFTKVNTPTVFNVRFNFRFNWDGEFDNLGDHFDALVTNPHVMNVQWQKTLQSLQQDPDYARSFQQIYPDGLTKSNVKDAIVAYELSLTAPNARFDRFLQGDKQALTPSEKAGYQLFKDYGCISCHQGVNVGGNIFQPFGVMGNYFRDRPRITAADLGRFNVTKNEADRHVFRVSSLRNVALTAPYFYDGSAETLEKAIAIMSKYQLGRPLAPEQIKRIAEFLRTLNGEYRGKPL